MQICEQLRFFVRQRQHETESSPSSWSTVEALIKKTKHIYAGVSLRLSNAATLKLVFLFRHSSELRLVRLKMSEGGVYTFRASNGDASVNHTFTIFVISKLCHGFL